MSSKIKERAFILQCIKIYKSQPALWNVKSKDYNNRQKKSDAYAILIHKYREKYPEATREDVTKKFNSLRTNFRKELKRINAKRSNASTDHVKKPTLWYFKEMSFLLEVIQNSSSTMDQFKKTEKEDNSAIVSNSFKNLLQISTHIVSFLSTNLFCYKTPLKIIAKGIPNFTCRWISKIGSFNAYFLLFLHELSLMLSRSLVCLIL